MINFVCNSNNGFEDQLTENKAYAVKELGENSCLITNDKGVETWYGRSHFVIKTP